MKLKTSVISRLALTAVAAFCLGASAMAGPGNPMYVMVNGKMMKVVPMTKDETLKNGCKVCTNGAVISPKGKKTMIKEGEMVTSEGEVMKPGAKQSHG